MKSRVEEDRCRRGLTLSAVMHGVTAVVSSADFDARTGRDTDHRARVVANKAKLQLFQSKRDKYWTERIQADHGSSKLWRTLSAKG